MELKTTANRQMRPHYLNSYDSAFQGGFSVAL
jgi:hypothetical protein